MNRNQIFAHTVLLLLLLLAAIPAFSGEVLDEQLAANDRIAVFAPDAGLEGTACYNFVKTVLYESEIAYDVIPYRSITDRTNPEIIQEYDLIIFPFIKYPRAVLVQTAIRNFYYTGGKVICFSLSGTYVQNLAQYIFGLKTIGSGITVNSPELRVNPEFEDFLPDSLVTLAKTSLFVGHSVESFNPKILMTINFAGKDYPAVVMTQDQSSAYFSIPLTGEGEEDEVARRKALFATVLDSVRAASRDTLALPETVEAIDYGMPKSIEFDKNVLRLNGEPFFAHGVGYVDLIPGSTQLAVVEKWMQDYAAHAFNTVVMYIRYRDGWFEYYEDCLDICQQYGLKVIIYFHDKWSTTPWRDEWTLELMTMRNHPALIGYCLVDDTECWHFPAVKRWSDLIRRYDPMNLITSTLLDFRHPERARPVASWTDWRAWMNEPQNFPLSYLYPLMRDRKYVNPVIDGGIEDIGVLAGHIEEQIGYAYHHQWLQAHMQGFAYTDFGLSNWETFVSSPEQIRLEIYNALLANVKGIYLFNHMTLQDSNLGRGRRNESGLVFRELDMVNDFITLGELNNFASASLHPELEIKSFDLGDESLLVLLRHDADHVRYVHGGTLSDLSIASSKSAYLLDFPGIRQLDLNSGQLTLDSFDLSAMILLTDHSATIDSMQARMDRWLPDIAAEALEVLKDKRSKTEVVAEKVAQSIDLPAAVTERLSAGAAIYDEARWQLENSHYADSYRYSREAMRVYREIQRELMEQAEAYLATNLAGSAAAREYLAFFFGLPKFYQLYASGSSVHLGELGTAMINRIRSFDNASAIESGHSAPVRMRLLPNYPNPFNNTTMIQYELSELSTVKLSIYNLRGQLMDSKVIENQCPGLHRWAFRAADLSSGIYICKMESGELNAEQKLILLK